MNTRRFFGAALTALALLAVVTPARAQLDVDRYAVAMMSASDVISAKRCAPPFGCRRKPERRQVAFLPATFAFTDLAARAGQYLGGNPTGWARVWCGVFMRMIVPQDPGPAFNAARHWRHYGKTAPGPVAGAIGVMAHHVGVVLGRCADGRIHLRSGNHNRRVGDGCYAASHFIAFRTI
jgi:hypothetical protein